MAGQMPDYNVRARTGRKDDQDKDIFMTAGVAWEFKSGRGVNIQINALPIGFDGYLMVVPVPTDER
jgi:hypothetical protein